MRVYELARQIDVPNKELIDQLKGLGIEVKSHSSSIDDKAVRTVLERLGKAAPGKTAEGAKPGKSGKAAPKAKSVPAAAKKTGKPDEAARESAPHKKDARAIALEAIARAKAKRARQFQERQSATEAKPSATKEPEKAAATEKPDRPAAPKLEPQNLDLETRKPVPEKPGPAARQAAPEPAPTPREQRPAPTSREQRPAPAAREQRPAPTSREQRPAPTAGAGQREQKAPPRPTQPSADRTAEQRRGRDREAPSVRGPRKPIIERRTVELQQLPSLPKRKTPVREEREAPAPDLTVPPAIEVMKLQPTRKPAAGRKGPQRAEEEKRKRAPARGQETGREKRIRPGRFLNIETIEEEVQGHSAKGVRPRSSILSGSQERGRSHSQAAVVHEPEVVKIHGDITLAEFAHKIGREPSEVITQAMGLGEMMTINQIMSADMCELIASEFEVPVEVIPEGDEHDIKEYVEETLDTEENLKPRPPVVTVMGHVDHGKTTLLDTIRKSRVTEGEFGGITQHIGAYHVETPRGDIVFLDTPGHAAFTAMRARGASVTDIVVLIVAADDGIMPQTVEAINHARAADVPIIVAINKIDLPGANVQRVKNDLMQHSLIGEDLGGETIMCEVSAKTGDGIDSLLEMIALQAEIMELKANYDVPAEAVVVESEIDPQRGTNATVLVRRGTLRVGDAFVCGDVSGRVRLLLDDCGQEVALATPSWPVEILGLDGCPQVAEKLVVLETERIARHVATIREERRRRQSQSAQARPHVTLEGLADYLNQGGKAKALNVILKADVQGSVEAVRDAVQRLSGEKVTVDVIHSGVGTVTESDVQLAAASDAIIIGFNVRPDHDAVELATQEGIDVKTYRVIYELIDEIQSAMVGMLDKKYREIPCGEAEVRQVFKISRIGVVAGCYVTSGSISRSNKARLVRDGVTVYEGAINTLRRVKDDVREVQAGYECGITLENFQDVKEEDLIETFRLEEVEQTL